MQRLGEPVHPEYSDGKTRVEWRVKTRGKQPTMITIYDYKDVPPVEQLDAFRIGGKGNPALIAEFLKKHFREDQIELDLIRSPQDKVVA